MSDTLKPKRAHAKSSMGARSRPPARDPRAEGSIAPRRAPSRPRVDAVPARVASLEAELRRLKEAQGAEADEHARMLVRIAASERARAVAEERAGSLSARVRELESLLEKFRQEAEAADMATRRAELAERSAADGAEALERTRTELEADRLRSMDLEAKLGRMRREHGDELAAMRTARAEAERESGRALEAERAAAAQARQRATAAEASLTEAHQRLARAMGLVEQIERREEMTTALRARAFARARQVLLGNVADVESGVVIKALGEDEIEPEDIEEFDGDLAK